MKNLYSGQIREIDGLRGIAIAMVMLHHFWPEAGPLMRFYDFVHLGWMGVDLFFVVSGFLIGGILLDSLDSKRYYANFYARRSLRIFPLYYCFLLVVFLSVPLVQGGAYFGTPFIRESGSPLWYFSYTANLREGFSGMEPPYYLAPLWSLCIEEQFYIAFPLIVAWLRPEKLRRVLTAVVILVPLIRIATIVFFPLRQRMQYVTTFSRIDVISFGVLLALLFRSEHLAAWRGRAGTLMLSGFLVATAVFFGGGWYRPSLFCRTLGYSLTACMFAATVLWTVLNRDKRATAILRFGPLTYMGKICYGLYLLHRPAESILLKTMAHFDVPIYEGTVSLLLAKVVIAIAVASCSWFLFEQPVLKLKRYFQTQSKSEKNVESAKALSAQAST